MTTPSATSARPHLYQLIDQVNQESTPITITGQRGNTILVGEASWQAIQETLYLTLIPGMAQSIRQTYREGLPAASRELDWWAGNKSNQETAHPTIPPKSNRRFHGGLYIRAKRKKMPKNSRSPD